jgi:phage shock protein C
VTAPQSSTTVSGDRSGPENVRRLYRSRSDRWIAGVCGGIAESYHADPRAVRLLTILLTVFTGIFPMLFVYLFAAVLLPDDGVEPRTSAQPGAGQLGLLFGALLILAGAAGIATVWLRVSWDAVWPVALIGLGGFIVWVALRGHPDAGAES